MNSHYKLCLHFFWFNASIQAALLFCSLLLLEEIFVFI
ncbi:hypothetical protein ES319_D11G377900v1 [Gossypium barbadense]|uniref:Uncharacterized protein n=2 Tax=Gossypium TaxID=3633 RepID=A0A5J5PJ80_GOSBA|nr:hypothetical protein ES319_D11G377900v1 [Gossypium barbadense]TYG48114.1 hypothetical protein ES288_D11G397600v1 [Gossypium darwinii]